MAHTSVVKPRPFAQGGGELGKLIDAFDWSATSLGPVSAWPQVVRNTVDLILRSKVAMVTMWGQDGVMIYNDGYARIAAERHPQQLGVPVRESWPEEAAFNDNVMRVCMAGGLSGPGNGDRGSTPPQQALARKGAGRAGGLPGQGRASAPSRRKRVGRGW